MPLRQAVWSLLALFFIAILVWQTPAAHAQAVQPIPALTARVIDQTGTLNTAQQQSLSQKLAAFEQSRGTQIVLIIIASTAPEDIAAYTQRVGDDWRIGRQNIGDALLLVVAKNDRRVRIATTKALEGALPDLAAQQIIDNAITPRFKQGDFAGGLNAGIDQLTARLNAQALGLPIAEDANATNAANAAKKGTLGFEWTDLAVFLFFVVPLGARLLGGAVGRKAGTMVTGSLVGVLAWVFTNSWLLAGGAAVLAVVFALVSSVKTVSRVSGGRSSDSLGTGSFGSSGFSSGSSSDGGFSSGGGGDFGGGGSSGSW